MACTFLLTTVITTFSSTPDKPKTEVGIGKAAQRTQPAKSEPTPPPAVKASDPPPQTQDAAHDRTSATDASSGAQAAAANETADADAAGKNDPSCAQQTWPYVNHGCGGAEPQDTRSVRVISPDRGAPSTVTTPAPAQKSARPATRTTGGSAAPDARTAKAPPSRETTGSSPSQASVALQPHPAERPESPAQAAVDNSTAKPKPETVKTNQASSTEMVKLVPPEASPTAEDTRSTSRSRDRHERRQDATRKEHGKRDAREARETRGREFQEKRNTRENRDSRELRDGREARDSREVREADDDDALRARASHEETNAPRSRATNDNGTRERRPRAAANDDDDGYTLVRSHRLREGRRATVDERPIERESKEPERERAPSTPFSFNPAGTGGY